MYPKKSILYWIILFILKNTTNADPVIHSSTIHCSLRSWFGSTVEDSCVPVELVLLGHSGQHVLVASQGKIMWCPITINYLKERESQPFSK